MRVAASENKGHMKRFGTVTALAVGIGLGCVTAGAICVMPSPVWAKEIVFVARDLEDQQAVWLPRDIIIRRSTDFTDPLIFRLDNPTARTHVFEAPGLYELIEESGAQIARPVRITIAPEESEQIVVDRNRVTHEALAGSNGTITYRFYCPLHRADADSGGSIAVEQ